MQSAANPNLLQVRAKANMSYLISTGQLSPEIAVLDMGQLQADIQNTIADNTLQAKGKKKVGKKSAYTAELLPYIEQMGAHGLNNRQIAKALGIAYETLYDWFVRNPEILLTLKKFRGIALIEVENAMFKSAIGYQFKEVKQERRLISKTKAGKKVFKMVTTQEVIKDIAPNLGAQVYITKNLMSHKYKDKVETTIQLGNTIESMAFVIKRREE